MRGGVCNPWGLICRLYVCISSFISGEGEVMCGSAGWCLVGADGGLAGWGFYSIPGMRRGD